MNNKSTATYLKPFILAIIIGGGVLGAAIWFTSGHREEANLNRCISNLKSIEMAKEVVAKENHLKDGDTITTEMLSSVLKQSWPLKCPSGGTYTINPVGSNAICSYPSHSIP
jgi:hypothetical protein